MFGMECESWNPKKYSFSCSPKKMARLHHSSIFKFLSFKINFHESLLNVFYRKNLKYKSMTYFFNFENFLNIF